MTDSPLLSETLTVTLAQLLARPPCPLPNLRPAGARRWRLAGATPFPANFPMLGSFGSSN